jgi:hypothetical protein
MSETLQQFRHRRRIAEADLHDWQSRLDLETRLAAMRPDYYLPAARRDEAAERVRRYEGFIASLDAAIAAEVAAMGAK